MLSDGDIVSLLDACRRDDERLMQGSTIETFDHEGVHSGCVMRCCILAFPALVRYGPGARQLIVNEWGRLVDACDHLMDFDLSASYFVEWYDSNPRAHVLAELANEMAREARIREIDVLVG